MGIWGKKKNSVVRTGYANLLLSKDINFEIPIDVFNLIWFFDGPFANYCSQKKSTRVETVIGDFCLYYGREEPSAISIQMSVAVPLDKETIDSPSYYPSYSELTPYQRWVYLNWLTDVEQEIDIGYVFIFYYGLERHLFFGEFECAYNMIMKLREVHKNTSFLGYSGDAIILASIVHNRPEFFLRYYDSFSKDNCPIDNMGLLGSYLLNRGLSVNEIISLASVVKYTNRRYIKAQRHLFEQHLKAILIAKYDLDYLPLRIFDIKKSPRKCNMLLANYSLPEKQRSIETPSLLSDANFCNTVCELLQLAHNSVKIYLADIRKSGNKEVCTNIDFLSASEDIDKEKEKAITIANKESNALKESSLLSANDLNLPIFVLVGSTGKSILYADKVIVEKRPILKKIVSSIPFSEIESVFYRLHDKKKKQSGFLVINRAGLELINYSIESEILMQPTAVACSGKLYNELISEFCAHLSKVAGIEALKVEE